jgi:integrase
MQKLQRKSRTAHRKMNAVGAPRGDVYLPVDTEKIVVGSTLLGEMRDLIRRGLPPLRTGARLPQRGKRAGLAIPVPCRKHRRRSTLRQDSAPSPRRIGRPTCGREGHRRCRIHKHGSRRTLRHIFATHILDGDSEIHTAQELLGHSYVRTTMTYIHVMNKGPQVVRSPLSRLTGF